MHVVFVTHMMPYPLTGGGNQRIFHLLRAIGNMADVTLICPTTDGRRPPEIDALSPFCKEMHFYPYESFPAVSPQKARSLLTRVGNVLRYHGHPTEPALFRWYDSLSAKSLIARVSTDDVDVLWAERLIGMSLLPSSLSARVIVDLDDILHRRLARKLQVTPFSMNKVLDRLEYVKLRRLESSLFRLPYEYVVCSESDLQALGDRTKSWVVPNGIDLPSHVPTYRPDEKPPRILFLGAMESPPNVDAALFFLDEILPLIRRATQARFFIVGRNPPPELSQRHDGQAITVTGTVPDVGEFLDRATVVVVPIRYGSGTRIKILEAWAHGRPVVSTSVGAEGLEAETGRHLLISDAPEDFAAACVKVLQNSTLRKALGAAGYELVRTKYQWSQIERRVQRIVSRERSQPVGTAQGSGERYTWC